MSISQTFRLINFDLVFLIKTNAKVFCKIFISGKNNFILPPLQEIPIPLLLLEDQKGSRNLPLLDDGFRYQHG